MSEDQPTPLMDALQTVSAAVALVGLGFALLHSGGRDPGSAEIAMVMAAPSLLAGQAWRTIPAAEIVAAALVVIAAVSVPLITPLGVSSVADLNAYVYASILYLAIRGYAQSPERRNFIAVAILGIAIVESPDVWRVWVGEHNKHFQVVGTFYWHNQFGAFAAAIALFAGCMAMRSRRVEDVIAWLVAPLFAALTFMSQSRGALLSLAVASSALVAISIVRRHWRPLFRLLAVAALAVVVHAGFVSAVTTATGGGHSNSSTADFSPGRSSLQGTSAFRVSAAEEAARVFAKAPLLSHGYGSLSVLGWRDVPDGAVTSPYAHSAELQAAVDGGLLLGLPVALALALMGWASLRGVLAFGTERDQATDWVRFGAAFAAVALLMHASMDFDSQYPALTALLAVLIALATPTFRVRSRTRAQLAIRGLASAVVILAATVSSLMVHSYWQTTHRLETANSSLSTDSAASVAIAREALNHHEFEDPRPAIFIVQATDIGYVFDDVTLREALRESRSYARLSSSFAQSWVRVDSAMLASSVPAPSTATHS